MIEANTRKHSWALGLAVFGGIMMLLVGILQGIAGISAIAQDDFYVTTPNYVFEWDPTAWGWVHLGIGVLVGFAAFGVFAGMAWARAVGMAVAAASAISNFMGIPNYPVWSITLIALDVAVIWALAVYMRPYRDG
ncbi:hypothetical protein ACGFNU_44725 [Spirillospora sp. NPDC048911]|uniref:DUF7144 family membrane protein n=1 Tax=Spirillospora sp. NPDC048911 TaxID=3364527 RepID=UPI00371D7ED9